MKFQDWFEQQGIISDNKFVESKDIPDQIIPLFEISGDFDTDIIILCTTLIGIQKFGFGLICEYPLFVSKNVIGIRKVMDSDLIWSLIALQETTEFLLSKLDSLSISKLFTEILNTDVT
jgi:hypothetical protein